VVICWERGTDLHMAQLMPLPLAVSCFSKIQIGFTFPVPAYPVVPDKGPLNGCVCVIGFYLADRSSADCAQTAVQSASGRYRTSLAACR